MPANPASNILCPQCPWLKANHGKRSKGGFYRKDNLRRLWNQVRNGGRQQSCHLTDPSHPDHTAAGASPDAQPRECTGSIVLITREIEKLRDIAGPDQEVRPEHLSQYLKQNPKGITKRGMTYWLIQRIHLGGVPIMGAPPIPALDQALIDDTERIGRLPD